MNRKALRCITALLAAAVLSGCSAGEPAVVTFTPVISTTSHTEPKAAESAEIPVGTTAEPEKQPEFTEATTAAPVYKNTIEILGPNMIYVGESFDYGYEISHKNADRANILWQAEGSGGEFEKGKLTAVEKGEITLKITDISSGLTSSLTVHLVNDPTEVDFVPEVNGIPIVNKTYPAPADYSPGGLLPEAMDAFMELKEAAALKDLNIVFQSGFRSFEEQKKVYEGWIEEYAEEADRISARPGYSEHQLGLAIDVNSIYFDFAETPEGIWLAENCWKFGFILRYPSFESESITGYMYEPWHIRYLGKELSEKVYLSGLTLEEYLGIDSWYRIEKYEPEEEEEELTIDN